MDWDTKITAICEELEIDPMLFNEDETTQEVIAKRLGFASYASFVVFPDPIAILDGRGSPVLKDHMTYQGILGHSCIGVIGRHWTTSQNREDLSRQIIRFYRYMNENFQYEYFVALDQMFREVLDHLSLMDDEMNDILSKYGEFVTNN